MRVELPWRTRLAQLIAQQEGFWIKGSLPQRQHNPGDLRHSPHSEHPGSPEAVGVIDSDEHGVEDLERQISLDTQRGLTLREFVEKYAPPCENSTEGYLSFVCAGLGLRPSTPLSLAVAVPPEENPSDKT